MYAKLEVNKKKIETKLFSQFHLQLSDVLNGAKFATEYSKHDKDCERAHRIGNWLFLQMPDLQKTCLLGII